MDKLDRAMSSLGVTVVIFGLAGLFNLIDFHVCIAGNGRCQILDPAVKWRCIEYVPGSADCATYEQVGLDRDDE